MNAGSRSRGEVVRRRVPVAVLRGSFGGEIRMGAMVDVVLADGHAVFLDGLAAVLRPEGYRVLATASTRAALLHNAQALQPGLCIIDSSFSDGDGADAAADIAGLSPHTKVVMLTADEDPETLSRALRAGVAAYVHKSRGRAALVETLRRVAGGEVVVEAAFSSPRRVDGVQESHELRLLAAYLTPREVECLALLAAGLGTSAISRRLGVSNTTIRSHIQAVLTKLGVHSRLEAASLAIRYGLVKPSAVSEADPDADNGLATGV